jgi:hypothetical protein
VRQQTHSQAEARSGKHVWHGHGGGDEQTREQTERFLRALDGGLCTFLAREPAPMILAAVAQEQDLYRSLSRLPQLVEEGLDGNPDRLTAAELHDQAWPIAKLEFDRPRTAAVEAYREAATVGEASDEAGEILRAVHEGRVSTLLLDAGEAVWGTYDSIERRLWTSIRRRPRDIDILDLAVRETILHGGSAFALRSEEMPTGAAMAAIYRY